MNFARLMAKGDLFPASSADITCVGSNRFEPGFCVGFDNGAIAFFSSQTGIFKVLPNASPSGEAINGVATIGTHSIAVSTRADVSFFELDPQIRNRAVYPGGAHGVIATRSGYFVSPLGPAGLLVVKPTSSDEQPMDVTDQKEPALYFSRVAALSDNTGDETLVFANRRNGVGTGQFYGDKGIRHVHTIGFEGIDVIDVCAVGPNSRAAIAISMKAEVLWIRDASQQDDPLATKLIGVEGPVYRVLATSRHLFVLSSKALYVWTDLVDDVLFNERIVAYQSPIVLSCDAVAMSLIDEECLLLVMAAANELWWLPVSDFEQTTLADSKPISFANLSRPFIQGAVMERLTPRWQSKDVEQRLMPVG